MSEERAKRVYNSARRRAQARETRRQILQAAGRLFTARGYAGTTMEALAQEAGVAVETVYAAFGNKREVLARLVDLSVAGDDEPTPLLERPRPRSVQAERNQRQQLHDFAHDMGAIMARVGPLFGVMRGAATTEPEIADLLANLLNARHANMRTFVLWLERNGPLRPELTTDDAADIVWTMSSAEVHQLLTGDRHWTTERYEQWLSDTLISLLLPAATDAT